MSSTKHSPPKLLRLPLAEFIRNESSGGAVLVLATVFALVWVNVSTESYHDFWRWTAGPASPIHLHLSLHTWVNDALMAIFFFAVGLEIKRELVNGELAQPRNAAMPLFGAIGGMATPALLYVAFNTSGLGRDGWGIPMATDIAFVLGVLSLLGRRAPEGLRLLLLAIAIVDDIGGIIVIALFYSDNIDGRWLLVALGAACAVAALRKVGAVRPSTFLPVGVVMWVAFHESGVHATIAGVVLGLMTPAGVIGGREVLDELEHRLHPISAFVIVPLFAIANAGVVLRTDTIADALASRVTWGIVVGLVVGKLVGISVAVYLAQQLHIGTLPHGVRFPHVIAGAALAGIGFTVSLFIAELSFAGSDELAPAKIGILAASVIAGLLAWTMFALITRREAHTP